MRNVRPASGRSCKDGSKRGGSSATMCGLRPAGPGSRPTIFVDTLPNWRRLRPTSSWPTAPQPWGRCCRRPALCQSCSQSSSIRSVLASSKASRGQAGTSPDSMTYEYSLSGKWVELLKQIAPSVTRAAVVREPTLSTGLGQFAAIQAVAQSLGLDITPVTVRDAGEIERAITTFARSPNGGLVLTASVVVSRHRDLIIMLAGRHKLPAVYYERFLVAAGGLISYGPDFFDQYRLAAGHVDRILRGEKPPDLPVPAPTKFRLTINLKTAKALGLEVPQTLLVAADEVIE